MTGSARPRYAAAVVVASGPSLVQEDVDAAVAWRDAGPYRAVVVVNNSFLAAPTADMLYAGDLAWFERYAAEAARVFLGQVWTGSVPAAQKWPAVRYVRRVEGDKLPRDGICVGGPVSNSGLQAIYLAACCGAERIALLGFDGGPAPDGRTHWHAPHEAPLRPCYQSEDWPDLFARGAEQLRARAVAVTNCSRETRLTSFQRTDLKTWISS